MRYWVRLGGQSRGPLEVAELALLPGMGPYSLLCPEGKDRSDRRHWVPANRMPEVLQALAAAPAPAPVPAALPLQPQPQERPRPAAQPASVRPQAAPARARPEPESVPVPAARSSSASFGPLLLLVGAAALVFAFGGSISSFFTRPASAPRPIAQRGPERSVSQTVLDFPLPACGGVISEVSSSSAEVQDMGDGVYRLRWTSAGAFAGQLMEFDYDKNSGELTATNEAAVRLLDMRSGCGQA